MLAAIERGRPPAIDFLNGEVATRGAALGIPTPINAAIREQVLQIARGKAKPSLELVRRFYEGSRGLVGGAAESRRGGSMPPAASMSMEGSGGEAANEPSPAAEPAPTTTEVNP